MLESEEVDDDYFTPVSKTSLASIFKKSVSSEKSENETLKYTPPVPKPSHSQEEPQKIYENIFSCVLDAYLWLDNVYTQKGKLGCAIVKYNTGNKDIEEGQQSFHSIVLYDSKRATVSSAIASNALQVSVKGKDVISYYDRYGKYWYLRGNNDDVKKIIDVLKTFNVHIKVLNDEDNSLPQQNQYEKHAKTQISRKLIESDTDSSVNTKTKASILNRMASMGQSVLPPRAISNEPSSDSDTDEYQITAVKHKPVKSVAKKLISEHQKIDAHKAVVAIGHTKDNNTCIGTDNQLQLQSSTTPIATTSGHDLNYFFTEQRISNSELRINMTRITDKVDTVLDKINCLEKDKHEASAVNTMIFQKLLHEYETKIKTYEELLQKVNKNTNDISKDEEILTNIKEKDELAARLNNKISEFEQKESEIAVLNNEIKKLKEINSSHNSRLIQDELKTKISEYEEIISKNNEMLSKLTRDDEVLKIRNDQIEQKIKTIMNETFRAIEANFVKNESYSGETIKNIIGTVIKKITLESLKDLKLT